ncbi:hypothetical protein F2Q69_00028752 [Brassica cretica]|uniref:Uncharacterized protein n=1 Tax=Brassica cretica TaxID=69181 RepID=A0A8S9RZJ7_BRACR|nr:hypothetical protein F2Q69_00028752 [Brassica cretica]
MCSIMAYWCSNSQVIGLEVTVNLGYDLYKVGVQRVSSIISGKSIDQYKTSKLREDKHREATLESSRQFPAAKLEMAKIAASRLKDACLRKLVKATRG